MDELQPHGRSQHDIRHAGEELHHHDAHDGNGQALSQPFLRSGAERPGHPGGESSYCDGRDRMDDPQSGQEVLGVRSRTR